MEASHVYINERATLANTNVQYKIGKKYVDFKKISTKRSILADSLFLRFMQSSITRIGGDFSKDFIVLKFNYNADYKISNGAEKKVTKEDLRTLYYKNGVTFTSEVKDAKSKQKLSSEEDRCHPIDYKMLMRSPGKAKDGECIFIRENLHHKAINFLTMGLYDLMDEESKQDPDKVFKIVELSAYLTLTTAAANGYIQIPWNRILVVPDEEVYSDPMDAVIVKSIPMTHTYEKKEFIINFDSDDTEKLINKKGFTFDKQKAKEYGLKYIEKTKEAFRDNNIRWNRYYGHSETTEEKITDIECIANCVSDERIKNILWDGMGLIDESIFPKNMNGFIYCRSHFFKSCLFRGNIREFFKDYCREHGIEYDNFTTEKIDLFGRKLSLSNIDVVITDKSLKWLKFIDMMGGNQKVAFKYYKEYMRTHDNWFSIVKTAHASKWGDMQLMAYQMSNSLPTTDKRVLGRVADLSVQFCNELKRTDDKAYLKYLNQRKNNFNINEMLCELVKWNPDFRKTDFFRTKKTKDISKLKKEYFEQGRLLQNGDNLTIMDNPIAFLLKAVGADPLQEGCFEVVKDGVQCYTTRFAEGDRMAAFRSPHNSPNNIIHLYNVYPDKIVKYFPNIGQNVIVFNAIGTDTQPRLSGHDVDSDFVYTTNQPDLAELARIAYVNYPTIINDVDEKGNSSYHFTAEDFAQMDNQIAAAQESIGTSTDTAQLALSYYYDEGMVSEELKECFVILSVIGQISIDLAKKEFNINVVDEINRIKRLPCMKNKDIPVFYAATKKSRNNKDFDMEKIRSMNCPMDIIADYIDEEVIGRADGIAHLPIRNFFNKQIIGKGNRYKKDKLIKLAKAYNDSIKYLENNKDQYTDDCFINLKINNMNQFLNRASKSLDQDTIFQLVVYALGDDNSDVSSTILNFLFREHHGEFINCFVKKC